MSDIATIQTPETNIQQQQDIVSTQDFSQALATSLWSGVIPEAQTSTTPDTQPTSEGVAQTALEEVPPASPEDESVDVDEYFKREFGLDAASAKAEWVSLRQLKESPPQPAEIKFANDDSKTFFQLLSEGKEDELYSFLNQKKQIERLEKLSIENTSEASEILRANLQFKNKNLSKEDVEFMVEETYLKPQKPIQTVDEEDADFSVRVKNWEDQVKRIDRKMIIDAKLAQNEIPSYKSQIVLPDIPKVVEVQQPSQKELDEVTRKAIENYQKAVQENYQNFKGFTTTAKDGDVQLPINYGISPEELIASKADLESFDINVYFEERWFDENNNPKILQIQEDLYLLKNRDKILQSIANEAASQRYLHHLKQQNNINLSGVNPQLGPPAQTQQKTENQMMAEQIWSF